MADISFDRRRPPTNDCTMCGPTPTGAQLPARQSLIPIIPRQSPPEQAEALFTRYNWNHSNALNLLQSPKVTPLSEPQRGGAWKTASGSDLNEATGFIVVHLRSAATPSDPKACTFEGYHFPTLCTAGQVFAYKLASIDKGQVSEPTDLDSNKPVPFMCIAKSDFIVVVRVDISPEDYAMICAKNVIGRLEKK